MRCGRAASRSSPPTSRCSRSAGAGRTAWARRCAGSPSLPDAAAAPAVDADRVLADLRELQRRTGDEAGAQRLCWSPGWQRARELLGELLGELDIDGETDEAGNLWATLEGDAEPALALGSHLDSVPGGGWLDGALGVMAALGVLRSWRESGRRPPRSLTLVDFADEEGARFGLSLYGSSAATGALGPADYAGVADADGRAAADVLAECGVDLDGIGAARSRMDAVAAYLELHIEQGPVLEREERSLAAVAGCVGIERLRFDFSGQAAHAGTTPMAMRRDAALAAAATALAVADAAVELDGLATTGRVDLQPGIPTAVAGAAGLYVDLRHADAAPLAELADRARVAASEAARSHRCELAEHPVWSIEPVGFDPGLVAAAEQVAGGRTLTSGALHDAAMIARVRPAAILFVPSIGGLSHAREEDTPEADLRAGIEAFAQLADTVAGGRSGPR